jgi:hypothetical protein
MLHIPNTALLLAVTDELRDFSFDTPAFLPLYFSVTPASEGASGTAVETEAGNGEASGDIFASDLDNTNRRYRDESDLNLEAADDLDGLDLVRNPDAPYPFYLISPIAPPNVDVFLSASSPASLLPGSDLGLDAGDDIDALHVDFDNDLYYFSFAEGSPSCLLPSCSFADVYVSDGSGQGSYALYASYSELGLLGTDDVDAIAFDYDHDTDGLLSGSDNCPLSINTLPPVPQQDTNVDNCGNACDTDYNNDGITGGSDVAALGMSFLDTVPPGNPDLDSNGDGVIGGTELAKMGMNFGDPVVGLPGLCP